MNEQIRQDWFVESLADAIAERLLKMNNMPRRLLDVEHAGIYLGRSPEAIYKLVDEGRLKPVRIDRRVQFDIRELDRVIDDAKLKR